MGMFYLDVRNVSKAKQSAVAKAAYASSDKLYSERDEETKSYRTRSVQPDSFILAPVHAPQWVYDRETLWNNVEKIEKNYNARLLKEIVVALPVELSNDEQKELLTEYVQETLVNDGMVADVNIHRDQLHNPHAHILLTVRPFNPDGTWWENKSKKEYLKDENGIFLLDKNNKKKSRKIDLTGWESKETLVNWRKAFAEKTNEHYKKLGIHEEISHLSYEEQGLDKLPKHRLNRSEYYVEKNAAELASDTGHDYEPVTYYGSMNKVIEQYNNEIEVIQNKIVSLEQYRNRKEPFEMQVFKDIRKKAHWASGVYEAVKFVKERSKSQYVDYNLARKTMDSLDYWKMSIERKHRAFEREKDILVSAKNHYEKHSTELFKMGFVREQFVPQFNAKAVELDKQFKRLSSEYEQFNEAYAFTDKALNFQTDLLREEFVYLYPKYEHIASIDSREIIEIMNVKVNEFKVSNYISDGIHGFDSNGLGSSKEEQEFRDNVAKTVSEYRSHSKQYFGLSKRVTSEQNEYSEIVKTHKDLLYTSTDSQNEVYAYAVKYLSSTNEMEYLSSKYDRTKNFMFNSLIELYGKEQTEVIEKLPDRIKVHLLEAYLKDNEVGDLKEDLTNVYWKVHDKKLESKWEGNKEEFTPFEKQNDSGRAIGNLLTDLIQQAQKNEPMTHDLEQKRKRSKRKNKKLTKEQSFEHGS